MFDLIAQNVIVWDINKLDREDKDFVVKFEDDDKEIVTCNVSGLYAVRILTTKL